MSAVFCLSFTERGRRIRRQWLTTSGTSFVGGAGGTTAYSNKSLMFNNQLELDRRRNGWSNRRSYTTSELIGKHTVVVDDNCVWNDHRQMPKVSSEALTELPYRETASATLYRLTGETGLGKLKSVAENDHEQITMI